MKLVNNLKSLRTARQPLVVAAGFFDGVHLGHQKVIHQAISRAKEIGGQAWALTFDKHPLRILNPAAAPPLLTSTQHKLLLLERLGLNGCILLPFNRKVAETEPKTFVRQLLDASPPLTEMVTGQNWRFGRKGAGDPRLLAGLSREAPLKVSVTRARIWKGETISSTRIRASVLSGRLEEAAAMLGRPFDLLGSVTAGDGIGRQLGYPTANLDIHNEALPPPGVYAAVAALVEATPARRRTPPRQYEGVVNFGVRPTIKRQRACQPSIEVHLLDMDRNLYGFDIEVFFIARLRNERKFSSRKALINQIRKDIEATRTALGTRASKKLKESLYMP